MRDPRSFDAALLARAASLPDAAIAELLRAERVAAVAELRVLEAARSGKLPPAVARGLAETRAVSPGALPAASRGSRFAIRPSISRARPQRAPSQRIADDSRFAIRPS